MKWWRGRGSGKQTGVGGRGRGGREKNAGRRVGCRCGCLAFSHRTWGGIHSRREEVLWRVQKSFSCEVVQGAIEAEGGGLQESKL
jgi:hypothetical protein